MGDLQVDGAPLYSEPEKQTARRIFVIGVVLDDVCPGASLSDLQLADVALHSPLEVMTTEFKLTLRKLPTDCFQRFHAQCRLRLWTGNCGPMVGSIS
jgi:hypothetical protein